MGYVSQCVLELFPSRDEKLYYAVGLGNIAQWDVETFAYGKLE